MTRKILSILLLGGMIMAWVACSDDDTAPVASSSNSAQSGSVSSFSASGSSMSGGTSSSVSQVSAWTIMVYLAADNSLNGQGRIDFNEMEQGLADVGDAAPGVNIIVLYDPAANVGWTDSRLYRLRQDSDAVTIASERLDDGTNAAHHIAPIGEKNMGDPATLSWFLGYCREQYPAANYGLIVWNHGGGARSKAGTSGGPQREIAEDQNSGDLLYLEELRQGIAAQFSGPDKLAFLGMDACFMGTVEVACELRDVARYMIASMAIEPSAGWDYAKIFGRLDEAATSPEMFAMAIVDCYRELYSPAGVGNDSGQTLVAVDLSRMTAVKADVDVLAGVLCDWIAPAGIVDTTLRTAWETLRDSAMRFFDYDTNNFAEATENPYFDLGDVCAVLASPTNAAPAAVRSAATAAQSALKAAVYYAYGDSGGRQPYYLGPGSEVGRGLSIFISPGERIYETKSLWVYQGWYTASTLSTSGTNDYGGIDFADFSEDGIVNHWAELFEKLYGPGAGTVKF